MKTVYLTTTIPYVNAAPHLGFALELVQADVLARYARLLGQRVRLQTGTDENAFKNVLSAQARGVDVQTFVADNSHAFRQLAEQLKVSHDDFVRTSEERHRRAVHRLWERLRPTDIYEAAYQGLYCNGCEDFLLERELVDGRCPDHRVAPSVTSEHNHFFRLSAYQRRLEGLIADGTIRIVPEERRCEVLAFIRRGLTDISISRDAARSNGWGVPVPGDPTKVVYVWVDALVNYLSGLGGSDLGASPFWHPTTQKVHVIGKNVWKFHAIYWPALLLSAGLPLPNDIVVHGFVTVNGRKISKSDVRETSVTAPSTCIDEFGADAVRYYLLRGIPTFRDGDFSADQLRAVYTTDLANGLGNLCTRLTTLGSRLGISLPGRLTTTPYLPALEDALHDYHLSGVLDLLVREVRRLNREIEHKRPWEFLTDGQQATIKGMVTEWLTALHCLLHWLQPIVPVACTLATECLSAKPVRKCPPLFPRK